MGIIDFFTSVDRITVDEALREVEQKGNSLILLDVREPGEYRHGHMPGAEFIPLSGLADGMDRLDSSKRVIAYCKRGPRSRSAAALLKRGGFNDVVYMDGGMDGWKGLVATGAYESGMTLLEGRDTLEDLVALGWSLEDGTGHVYSELKELTDDQDIQSVLGQLVKAEQSHKMRLLDTYREIRGKEYAESELKERALKGVVEGGDSVENVVRWVKQTSAAGEDILEIAMQIETNSLDLYMKMAAEFEKAPAHSMFQSLIEEEKTHLAKLGKLLGSKIHYETT